MADFLAEMTVERLRCMRGVAGHVLTMLPIGGARRARIAAGLLRCRIVAEELIESLGGRGRQTWGAPLGTATYGERTVGGPARVRTLGITTLGGRIRGHSIR